MEERVTFTFTNTGTTTINVKNSGPWVIKDSTGTIVFHPIVSRVMAPVESQKALNLTWDQKDDNGKQVPDSIYTIASILDSSNQC